MQNQNQSEKPAVTMPNLNMDQTVENIATTVGAYTGAAITAGITGIFTLGAGLFRGAFAGAVNTWNNGTQRELTPEEMEIQRLKEELARAKQS